MSESSFYKALFDGMRCGILSVDRSGRVVIVNDLAMQILDMTEPPEAGTPVEQALEHHPALAEVLRDCFSMDTLPNREELRLGTDPAEGRTIGYTLSLVSDDQDRPAGAAVFFKDLTLIEQKNEQERLKDRLAALGQMAASLAHEIRNPLASIEVTGSLLRRRLPETDGGRELLDKITAEVRRLNQTITSSLEFVRPVSLSLGHAGIVPILEEAIEVARGRRNRPSVRIETRFADSLPSVLIDRDQIRQVFENLILNAMEAVDDEGQVVVEAGQLESKRIAAGPEGSQPADDEGRRCVEIRVADSGPGISEDDKQKIFHPFYTTKEQGSGVGLSMAKKIVDCHQGLIRVENGIAGGAVFTVRLPMHDDRRHENS